MPQYKKADYDTFMQKVRQANSHYERFRESSLHHLIQLLNSPTTRAAEVNTELSQLSHKKQTKYKDALDHLRRTYPGLGANQVAMAAVAASATRGSAPIQPKRLAAPPVAPSATDYTTLATDKPQRGWFLIVDPDPVIATADLRPPLNRSEINRINEAISRTGQAIDAAIRGLSTLRPAAGTALDANQQLYKRFWGAFDATRKTKIQQNFQQLARFASGSRGGNQGTIAIIDARNDSEKADWFAATTRNSVQNNTVRFWLGRTFFIGTGNYAVSSDATIVTFVHELSHAVFDALDVPVPGSPAVLNADGYPTVGGVINNSFNAADTAGDEALANANPAMAVRNADNYGQYAWAQLEAAGG
jgi:hypothetical protein